MSGAVRSPSSAEVLFEACSNRGRWGKDDQLGTLNLIDASVVRRALATVTRGEVVALGRPLVPPEDDGPGTTGAAFSLRVSQSPGERDALDTQVISPHGFEVTHLDAVGHSFYNGLAYNGRRMKDVVGTHGLASCGIEAMAAGIVTRGVMLDVVEVRNDVPLSPGDGVTDDDLTAAELRSGAEILPGDAVLVRTGTPHGVPTTEGRRAGLLGSAVRWLHQRQVALYAGDCIERLPGENTEVPMVLHQVGHVAMGLAILDNPDIEAARRACERHGRRTFLLVLAPLAFRGATGCAVNPLAIF